MVKGFSGVIIDRLIGGELFGVIWSDLGILKKESEICLFLNMF
jgi:hypothetical protein